MQRITVCTRPFRAQGPRLEAERVGDKLVVHNYGHGGSGWSLSWGSAAAVVGLALQGGAGEVAVVGCGALGLTAAIALQRAGANVTIYAKDLPPDVRSSRATGSWTPDARVALADAVDAGFAARWEQMARVSFAEFEGSLSLEGEPIRRQPRYFLADREPDSALAKRVEDDPIGFLHLEHRLENLVAPPVDLRPGMHPFGELYCRRFTIFRFDITAYSQYLLDEFRSRGGVIQQTEFYDAREFASLSEPVIVNCTGYGARTLFGDESLTPIRGQINWLPAQAEVDYSLQWENLNVVSRPDGMVVQLGGGADPSGWNDPNEEPSLQEAEDAIRKLVRLQSYRQR